MRLEQGAAIADGRYTFARHLGSGGMASVWLARDETLQRDVAIKVVSDSLAHDERWLARFRREARAAAALSHPHVVKVFDFGVEEHRPFLVMAYVPCGSLRDRLKGSGALPDPERLARELLGALAHVHGAGILHRDVKPGNLLLDEHDRCLLTDFGIALPSDATAMTQTGMVLGTLRYLAPEVADGGPATERSDLYAAGAVIREVAGDAAKPPRLEALLDALTDRDPEQRPSSADAALARLDESPTRPTVPLARTRPRVQVVDELIRRPWFLPAAGIAAVVLVAVIVIALAAGGGGGADGGASPAPASAPLDEQLRGLDRAIDAAATRRR
jgi:serine/threonine protein kinase